jgi:hypothetical protein
VTTANEGIKDSCEGITCAYYECIEPMFIFQLIDTYLPVIQYAAKAPDVGGVVDLTQLSAPMLDVQRLRHTSSQQPVACDHEGNQP